MGFVCGYPVGIGGELYGGSMFIKSAASYTDQGKAIQSINEKWGEGSSGTGRPWGGRETIGIQVCKKKYSPFLFTIDVPYNDENDTKNCSRNTDAAGDKRKVIKVVRMFGCPHHSDIRKQKIECHGIRKGWEPFGQWSLRKAEQLARRETVRLNSSDEKNNVYEDVEEDEKIPALPMDGSNDVKNELKNEVKSDKGNSLLNIDDVKTICHNGKCLWKKRNKYDDIYNEITGFSESSSEEDT